MDDVIRAIDVESSFLQQWGRTIWKLRSCCTNCVAIGHISCKYLSGPLKRLCVLHNVRTYYALRCKTYLVFFFASSLLVGSAARIRDLQNVLSWASSGVTCSSCMFPLSTYLPLGLPLGLFSGTIISTTALTSLFSSIIYMCTYQRSLIHLTFS